MTSFRPVRLSGCIFATRSVILLSHPISPFPRRLGSPTQSNTMSSNTPMTDYRLPTERLHRTLRDSSKQPIVLVACGSFSPVTYLHLRMFEMAVDYARQNTDFEIMGGYLSPVSDMYKKPGLLSASHRFVLTSSETQ